jgi:hypothetical protein
MATIGTFCAPRMAVKTLNLNAKMLRFPGRWRPGFRNFAGAAGFGEAGLTIPASRSDLRDPVEARQVRLLAHLAPPHRKVTRQTQSPAARRGSAIRLSSDLRETQQAYALAGALRAFFTGDLIAAAVVLAAAARTTGLRFSAAAGLVPGLRPSPIDFARADRVAA